MQDVLNNILENAPEYVFQVKAVSNWLQAGRRDNAIVYFTNPSENTEVLADYLLPLEKYTWPSHPPMMKPINREIQGIAFADEDPAGESFGYKRSRLIAEALWSLWEENKEPTLDQLLSKVEEEFEKGGIDPKKPHLNLPIQRD